MRAPTSFQQARDLAEARKALRAVLPDTDRVIFRHRFSDYQTGFNRPVVVSLTAGLDLRVTCGKTGELIVSGPATPAATPNKTTN